MENEKIRVLVTSPKKEYDFEFRIHHSESGEDRRIETIFYRTRGESIPVGDHHEVEVVKPDLKGYDPAIVHYHDSKKRFGTTYICWTGHLPKYEQALSLLETWASGAVHAMETGIDIRDTLEKHGIGGENFSDLKRVMETKYNIKVEVLKK